MKRSSAILVGLIGAAWMAAGARGADADGRMMLDGAWKFRTDPAKVGEAEGWAESAHSDGWDAATVPENWDTRELAEYDGFGWYRREFTLPDALNKDTRWGLCLLGVDDAARVWVNGREVGVVEEYDQRTAFDVSDAIRAGTNTIAIRVEDRGGPGGVIRSVYLQPYRGALDEILYGPHREATARSAPEWAADAVVYEVYLRSFSDAGTFAGLTARLDELKTLGVNVLWLMPIHPVGVEKRKGSLGSPYAVQDYLAVNPEFGTLDDFRALVAAAHERDLKVIIDWVANHTAWDNPLIHEHPEWYTKNEQGAVIPPNPDWADVADLNFEQKPLWAYMTAALEYWVKDVGIDGYRCDVAGLVPLEFWEQSVAQLDAPRPVFMLAEDDNPAQHINAFNATYDWRTWVLLGKLPQGELTPEAVRRVFRDEELEFPRGSLRMRFSDNHDKCAWDEPALPRLGPEAARLAAVMTFTLPGIPLIYNGQEVGNTQKLSLFEKMPIDWKSDPHDFRQLYTDLAKLRRDLSALRRGRLAFLTGLDDAGVLAFTRAYNDETVHVVMNLRPEARVVEASAALPERIQPVFGNAQVAAGPTLRLPPFGYWVGVVRAK